jgi:hypothetical protein
MTRKHSPADDPAFLRGSPCRDAVETRTIQASPKGHFVDLVDHDGMLLLRIDWHTNINSLGFAHPDSDAQIVCAEHVALAERRERELLRAQLRNEAADCWRRFFGNFAPTDTAALVDTNPAPTIDWHFADKAREFEAAAAGLVV